MFFCQVLPIALVQPADVPLFCKQSDSRIPPLSVSFSSYVLPACHHKAHSLIAIPPWRLALASSVSWVTARGFSASGRDGGPFERILLTAELKSSGYSPFTE